MSKRLRQVGSILCWTIVIVLMIYIADWSSRGPKLVLVNPKAVNWTNKPYPGVDVYIEMARSLYGQNHKPTVNNNVTSFNYPVSVSDCEEGEQLFATVISAAGNVEKREIIRETWGRHLKGRLAFFVGLTGNPIIQEAIEDESYVHEDMVQIGAVDRYVNMPLKAVGALSWIHQHCPKIRHVLKVDDDVYVNTDALLRVLKDLPEEKDRQVIYGVIHHNVEPQRDDGSKWKISFDEWPWESYPPYFSGGSVLIPGRTIGPLLAAAEVTPYLWIDDIYLSGLLAEKANISLRSSEL